MLRIGLTGGLASGKTFVGQALQDLGCHLLKADDLGRQVLEPGQPAFQKAIDAFGPGILSPDGQIDRRRLGQIVFHQPEELNLLNSLVHPAVIALEESWIHAVAAHDPAAIAVVEAAILVETGSYRRFDKLVLALCTTEQQIERAIKRDGLSRDEVIARLARQMPLAEKRTYADYVIDTSGPKEDTLAQVRALYAELRRLTA
ncbi:MAG: dephospho-CoA kinase [Acidobacteria bacterium]|nr:dephospho-CoA kinase [Acidobacteriota bacterium]